VNDRRGRNGADRHADVVQTAGLFTISARDVSAGGSFAARRGRQWSTPVSSRRSRTGLISPGAPGRSAAAVILFIGSGPRRLQAGSRCDCGALLPYLKISAYRSNAGADVRDTAARARAQHRDTIKRTSGASGIEAEDQAMSEAINQFEAGCPRCAVRFAAAG